MELLGDVLGRVLAGVRTKMDERKAGAGGEARPGKVAPGGGGAGVKAPDAALKPLNVVDRPRSGRFRPQRDARLQGGELV